jgi:hypothetical protein
VILNFHTKNHCSDDNRAGGTRSEGDCTYITTYSNQGRGVRFSHSITLCASHFSDLPPALHIYGPGNKVELNVFVVCNYEYRFRKIPVLLLCRASLDECQILVAPKYFSKKNARLF